MPKDKAKRKRGGRAEHGDKGQALPRPSKFKEGTMNSTTEIRAPPDELWEELGIEHLLDRFNEEDNAPAAQVGVQTQANTAMGISSPEKKLPDDRRIESGASQTAGSASEGPLDRFSRAVASFFHGAGATFSGLGKRKAGNEHAETKLEQAVDSSKIDRKAAVDAAYQQAKEGGLLPTPKVFVRPVARARKPTALNASTSQHADPDAAAIPRTPRLSHTPSKKDLHMQEQLFKRVSELEVKLSEARKDLRSHLDSPIVSAHSQRASIHFPSPPSTNDSPEQQSKPISPEKPLSKPREAEQSAQTPKAVKKRKVTAEQDQRVTPMPTDTDVVHDTSRENKKARTTPSKPKVKKSRSSRLLRRKSSVNLQEDAAVVVVPDGENVPPIPDIPKGVEGKKATVGADAYGGLEHEMF